MQKRRVIICGAAGRDFHNFNVLFRNNPDYEVVAFTAAQIPDIDGRAYPPDLAGTGYPKGIPIRPETKLADLVERMRVDDVVFSYSDVPFRHVMHVGSIATAAGARFVLPSPTTTMLPSSKPVVSVCAVRTGCGKSQTSRFVAEALSESGRRVVVVRHPMPYGDLRSQRVQRFASIDDLARSRCTIEEMEEYEPHLDRGRTVYAGVDYEAILRQAEQEADVILWDGGNNDTPFFRSDLEIVVADPLRAGHELEYYPGETNFLRADLIIVNKVDSAEESQIALVEEHAHRYNPTARVIRTRSEITVDHPEEVKGKRVLVVEDGPTLTHGEMTYGAGVVAARRLGAGAIVDPRPATVGSIAETYRRYPGIGTLLPAMGYGDRQIRDLEETIRRVDCDLVLVATPVDLGRILKIDKPALRVRYELREVEPDALRKAVYTALE